MEEYPSVFLALLMNRHLGGSRTDNFFTAANDAVAAVGGRPVPPLPSLKGDESSIIQYGPAVCLGEQLSPSFSTS
jgi:hypothetical protein